MIVGLDSNILIYVLDDDSPFSESAQLLLKNLELSKSQVYVSVLARTEILHQPYQISNEVGDRAKQFLSNFDLISFLEVTVDIADKAAELCAKVGAKLNNIDSIHLASALSLGATEFWTNDRDLLKVKIDGFSVKSLKNIV